MPERFARIAALALLVVLILMLPLLVSLFGTLSAPAPAVTPTREIAIVEASPTRPLPTNTAPIPTETRPPTLTPSPSPTAGCPIPATPEPLWVNPVISPTNLSTQRVSVTLGRGRVITVTSEGGTVTQQGEFSTARPVEIEIPLAPNAANNLLVTGQVEYAAGCLYTLETRIDRVGNPLVIVQTSVTVPTSSVPPTAPPEGTVYVRFFAQVFALNQDAPTPADKLYLYETDTIDAFQILGQAGAFTHVLSQGGSLNFWTLNENVVTAAPPFPQHDQSAAGKRVEFVSNQIFACEAQYPRPLILGLCEDIGNVTEGEVVDRAQIETSRVYLVRLNNKLYWVSASLLKQEPQ